MNGPALDQAVIETMNELMRASSECAEFDPGMSAKFAAAAKDFGRDLGIAPALQEGENEPQQGDAEPSDEDQEVNDLIHLLNLQKRAVAAAEGDMHPKSRLSWLGLDVWSRW